MVFRYDAALDLVFKEEFTEKPADQEGEENAQQPQQQQEAVVNEPRRKRPRYGNYELPFPKARSTSKREMRKRNCKSVAGEVDQVRQQHLSSSPSTTPPSRRRRGGPPTKVITIHNSLDCFPCHEESKKKKKKKRFTPPFSGHLSGLIGEKNKTCQPKTSLTAPDLIFDKPTFSSFDNT